MGGKRQANILSSLISNFQTVEDVIATSMNSSGSAMAENAKWLDSIEGKTYQFTNALETMWSNMINSETVKTVIDFGTKLIQILDTLPGKITAIAIALVAVAKFKGFNLVNLGPDALNMAKQYSQITNQLSAVTKGVKNGQKGSVSKFLGTGADLQKHTAELNAYANAVKGLGAEEQAEMLIKQGLNREQVTEIMRRAGVKEEVIQETLSKKMLSNATSVLQKQTVAEFAAANMSAEALQNEAMAAFLAENGHKKLNQSLLDEMRTRNLITDEQYLQYTQQLSASFGQTLKQIAKSPTVIMMAATAIAGLIENIETAQEAAEKLKEEWSELQSSISELEGEIDSLDSELSTIQEQIDALTNKDSLSLADAEELNLLKQQSAELERQKELQEKILKARTSQEEKRSLQMINSLLSTTAANQQRTAESWEQTGSIIGGILLAIAGAVAAYFTAGSSLVLTGAIAGGAIGSAAGGAIGNAAGNNATKISADTMADSLTEWYDSYETAIEKASDEATEAEAKYLKETTDSNYDAWQKKLETVTTLQTEMYDGLTELQEYIGTLEYTDETQGIIDGYNKLMTHIDVKNTEGNIDAQVESIEALRSEYAELSKGVDENGKNIALSTEEYARYCSIVEQLLMYTPQLIQGYDAEGNAILNRNSLLQDSIDLLRENQRLAAEGMISDENMINAYKSQISNPEDAVYFNLSGYFDKFYNDHNTLTQILRNAVESETGIISEWGTQPDDFVAMNANEIRNKMPEILEYIRNNFTDQYTDDYGNPVYASDEDLEEIVNGYKSFFDDIFTTLEEADLEYNGFRNLLYAVPQASDYYHDLSGTDLEFINSYVDSFEDLSDLTDDEVKNIRDQILSLTDVIATDKGLQELVNKLFSLDSYSMPVAQYEKQFNDIWDEISPSIPEEHRDALLKQLFPDQTQIEEMTDAVGEKLTNSSKRLLDSLSLEELRIAFKIRAELPDDMTFRELKQAIEEHLPEVSGPVVQTYSTLSSRVEQFNEVTKETSEVILDNTKVTQDYKDSLIELGVSEDDLAECFDATNPLIVRNADLLNSLLKDTKKNITQNIKLAKSQSTLKYYEKYKELKQLTNGQKVTTAATLNQVKAIYAEMTALQKSISRYNMLEHQLLGATNAYEEFAKAQEIDESNDYETKAENLVGYLVDAFQTGKLGAESAQAAIKGLVPESVYEDLNTLDEKMEAVYKYFTQDLSKYFYVKFNEDGSLESAEMLVDNVKKFVEDGIDKGVFTGSWEEWDLGSTINSLDELAEKMGVTKEVAYAFLQAMETYDISWIGGDASTLLDKLIPTTSQIMAAKESMQEIFNQTPIDLTARVKVSAEKMKEAGYTDFEGDYATVYSTSFNSENFGLYNEDGSSFEILATPILPNGDVLSSEELVNYINKELASGKALDKIDVFIGSYASVEEAEEAAQVLHDAQERYYDLLRGYNLENAIQVNTQKQAELEYKLATGQITADTVISADGKTTAQEQLNKLNEEAAANAQAARENIAAWTDAKQAYDEAAESVEKCNQKLEEAKDANDPSKIEDAQAELKKAESTMWDTYAALCDIGEPVDVVVTVAKEQVEKDIKELEAKLKNTFDGIEIDKKTYSLEDFITIDASTGKYAVNYELVPDGYSTSELERYVGLLNEKYSIDVLQTQDTVTTLDVLNEIKDILSQTYQLMVDTSDAETKTKSFSELWSGIKDKTVTLWQNVKQNITDFFTRTPDEGDGADVNGTAHVGGTAFAGGSWGASKTETALVGELGPELLVRGNRWTTIGENGAEFTQVRKGDIIFNHKQTKSLLENGYVTSRGKAYASGTALYGGSVHPWLGGMGNIDNDWQNITPTLWDAATNGEHLADAMADAADSVGDFNETLDWIEIRLEELDETLSLLNAQLENTSHYSGKNSIIDNIIGVNKTKLSNLESGYKYYLDYAEKYLEGMSEELADAARNGAIEITEFTKEADEKTVEAINNYRDYAQKAADLKQQAEEVLTEIRDLTLQKIDNIYDSGEAKTSIEDKQTDKLQSAVDYDEEKGLIADSNHYVGMMENSSKKIEYWTPIRDAMQAEFSDALAAGLFTNADGTYNDLFYENLEKLYEVDAHIDEATKELEEFQNAINDIYWDNFDELINRLDYISEEAQGLIDLMDSADMFNKPDNDKGWSDNDVSWTSEGLATLGLHAQKMEQAEEKAKAYAEAIDDLNAEYKAGHYSESEYYEKLNELTQGQYDAIEAAQEEKEAIVELNEQRIEAVKEGIDKQVEAYEELINKQKEALESERDLHDFQKSVAESSKNIADIERKLAALSVDNSAAAVAQKKKLEQELAEAKSEQEELYYNRSIEDQQTALDNSFENFEEEKEAEKEKLDKYLEDVEQIVADSLGIVSANAAAIGDTLTTKAEEYNLTVSDAVLKPWEDGMTAISEYTTVFGDATSSTVDQLESIRSKWQGIKEEMAEANAEADKYYNKEFATEKSPSVADINKENANYAKATKKQTTTPTTNNKPANKDKPKSTPQYTTYTVQSGDTLSGIALDKLGSASKWNEIYNLNKDIISDPDLIYVGQKLKLPKYAKGTKGITSGGLAIVDENQLEELVLGVENGRLTYLSKGSSVIPADITSNLMSWGELDPQDMIDRNRPVITAPHIVNNEINISMDIAEVVHIDKVTNDTLPDLTKAVEKQMDAYMGKLNNAIRKFSR